MPIIESLRPCCPDHEPGEPCAANFGIATLNGYRDSRIDRNLAPTISATYVTSEHQTLYAKYSKGFKSGGWNVEFIDINAAQNPSFDAESVDSIEVGAKGKMFGGRLRYDLSAYSSRFKDYQVFQFIDLGGGATSIQLKNAAQAKTRGLDGSLALRLSEQLKIGVLFNVSKAVFGNFDACSPSVDCTGNMLPFAPKLTSALTVNYVFPSPNLDGQVSIDGVYSYSSKSFSDPLNDPATQRISSHDLVNVRLSYLPNNSRWNFSLWVRNLFDKDTVVLRSRDFLGNLYDRRMDPRIVGIEARFDY